MSASLNRVILIGNLGKDPEIRTMQDGKEIANFSIATSESWKDKNTGEKKDKTEWHRVVVFNPSLVTIVKNYIKKGSKVYIEGALQTRKWQSKDGSDHYATEIVLQAFNGTIKMLDGKRENEPASHSLEADYNPAVANPHRMGEVEKNPDAEYALDDEIPF